MQPLARPFPLVLLLSLLACTPKSLSVGDEFDTDGASETDIGDPDTDDPPTGTGDTSPAGGGGGPERIDIAGDILARGLAVAGDGSIVAYGTRGFKGDADGTYVGNDAAFTDQWLARFDADGALAWELALPLVGLVEVSALALGPAGDIYLTYFDGGVPDTTGHRLERRDPAGTVVWTAPLEQFPRAVTVAADGTAVVGGSRVVGTDRLAWAVAFDPLGAPVWEQTYGAGDHDGIEVSALAVDDADGALVLAGYLRENEQSALAWVRRVELGTGAELWDTVVGEVSKSEAYVNIGLAADGTILSLVHEFDPVVRGTSRAGDPLWTSELLTPGAHALAVAPDGSFAVVGGDDHLQLERRAADRSLQWLSTSGTCKRGVAVAPTPGDGVVAFGQCVRPPDGPLQVALLLHTP